MNIVEKLLLNYNHKLDYAANVINGIGPLTSTTLRSLSLADNGTNTLYVRKFGTPYKCKSISNIIGGVNSQTYQFYAMDGTLLAYMDTGNNYHHVADLSVAQAIYLVVTKSGGGASCGTSINLTTDLDGSGYNFYLTNEVVAAGSPITFYLSDTGSTYYDQNLMYGGARHTPTGTTRKPYFHIIPALAALATTYVCVTVLDSATYDGEITISGAFTLQAALGQTPTITCGIGARASREVVHDGNNTDTCYISSTGNDTTGNGTFQLPYFTISKAISAIGSLSYINFMDSGTYSILSYQTLSCNIEPCYGQTPTIKAEASITAFYGVLNLNSGSYFINGLIIDSQNLSQIGIYITSSGNSVCQDNTIKNCYYYGIASIPHGDGNSSNIQRNITFNFTGDGTNFSAGIYFNQNGTSSNAAIDKNLVYGSDYYGIWFVSSDVMKSSSFSIQNNLCRNNGRGIFSQYNNPEGYGSFGISYNTCVANGYGIYSIQSSVNETAIIGNISYLNTVYDVYSTGPGIAQIDNTCYLTQSGITIGTGNITTDPDFIDPSNDNYCISPFSPCYKHASGNDIGISLRNILISSSNVSFNGINFDGQNIIYNSQRLYYNQQNPLMPYPNIPNIYNGIGKTGSPNYSGLNISWCSIFDYSGMGLDDYATANTNSIINNSIINSNGAGLNLSQGGNSLNYSIIYQNKNAGVYENNTGQSMNHCISAYNGYGYYFDSLSNVAMKNSISYGNGSYGVYSQTTLYTVDCNFFDNVSGVNPTYLQFDPLFVSTIQSSLDFHLRSTQGGYIQFSSLIGKADDGYDIGAYLVSYALTDDNWNSYQITYNPKKLTPQNTPKGVSIFENALGSKDIFIINIKRQFLLDWEDSVSDPDDRDKLEYFASQQKNRIFSPSSEIVKFRLHFQPTSFMDSGTGAVVSATNKTIGDSTKTWTENKHRGYHVGIKFYQGTGLVINATALTATDGGASWTTNQWAGYYICINSNYFIVISNTSTVLTLSDYYGQLVNGTLATYSIEKYFKINSNTLNVLNVDDDNAELPTGNYDWYIDFIEVRIIEPTFIWVQDPFTMARPHAQGQYTIQFEEM